MGQETGAEALGERNKGLSCDGKKKKPRRELWPHFDLPVPEAQGILFPPPPRPASGKQVNSTWKHIPHGSTRRVRRSTGLAAKLPRCTSWLLHFQLRVLEQELSLNLTCYPCPGNRTFATANTAASHALLQNTCSIILDAVTVNAAPQSKPTTSHQQP